MMKKAWILGVLFWAGLAGAGIYSGGDGTESNPYQISTPADWQVLMSTPSDWDKHFRLTGPLDLTGITLTPVGNSSTPFTGVFHGEGWTIRNPQVNQPTSNYVGLFGNIKIWPGFVICR